MSSSPTPTPGPSSSSSSNSTTTTHTYSHKISSNRFGNARYVAYGKTVTWKKWQIYTTSGGGCGVRTLKTGKIKFPMQTEGWRYWETTS